MKLQRWPERGAPWLGPGVRGGSTARTGGLGSATRCLILHCRCAGEEEIKTNTWWQQVPDVMDRPNQHQTGRLLSDWPRPVLTDPLSGWDGPAGPWTRPIRGNLPLRDEPTGPSAPSRAERKHADGCLVWGGVSIITAPPWTLLTSGATSCSFLSEEERRKAWPPHVSPWPRQKAALWLVFLPRLRLLPGGRVVSAFHKVRPPHASDPLAGVGAGASLTDALAASFLLQQWPKRGLGPGAPGGLVGGRSKSGAQV